MKILLVQCPFWLTETPPYNLALLNAILKKRGYESDVMDLNIEFYNTLSKYDAWPSSEKNSDYYHDELYISEIFIKYKSTINNFIQRILDSKASVLGFTVYDTSELFTNRFIKIVKEKDSNRIIVVGGPQYIRNMVKEKALHNTSADAICLGEADISFPDWLDSIKKSKSKLSANQKPVIKSEDEIIVDDGKHLLLNDLDSLPFADYSGFDLSKYTRTTLPISTNRGCINRCIFCSECHRYDKFRTRSAESIYNEIIYHKNKYPHIKEFWFNGSLVNGDIKVLSDLCDLIIKNKVKIGWNGQAVIRKEMTIKLLNKLKMSGCFTLIYGVESGNNKILKQMRRNYTANIASKVLSNTFKAGINANFNIIVGFPTETEKEFKDTISFIDKNMKYANTLTVNVLHVQKESEMGKNIEKWGIKPTIDLDTFWITKDGKNNHDERLRRFNICCSIAKGRALGTDSQTNMYLRLGDYFYKNGNSKLALYYYKKADVLHTGFFVKDTINKKISEITRKQNNN